MSMESAMKVLSISEPTSAVAPIPSNIDSKGSPQANQGSVDTQGTPKTLQEAVTPIKQEIEPKKIGADRFAALAKQERALRAREAKLKQSEGQMATYNKARQEALSNPIKAMEALGISYDQLTQFLLNGQKPTPELELQGVKQEIERLRQETALKEKRQVEEARKRAEQEYKQTLADFSEEVASTLTANADKYELTNMYDGKEIVLATIEQHFAQTKKIMSIDEAATLVEKYFEEQVQAAQKSKKFQAKQMPKEEGQSKGESRSKQTTTTLSNELTSSAPSLLPAKTEQDRLQRAMAALNR